MKKSLLFIGSLLFSGLSMAQFTGVNAPKPGESLSLYVLDSTAADLANVTGDGVVWDYSSLTSYNGAMKTIQVLDPTQTAYSAKFGASSDYAITIDGLYTGFVSTDNDSKRITDGVVYADMFGTEVVLDMNQPGTYITYPFSYGDELTSNVAGSADIDYNSQTFTSPATGTYHSKVDGKGKLKLPSGITYDNVIRLKIADTLTLTTPLGTYDIIQTQFKYFDFEISHLPIFRYEHVWIGLQGATTPKREYTLVLGLDNENTSSIAFTKENAPIIGDASTLYVVDSSVTAYDNITGKNVTWDYSNATTEGTLTKTISVVDPAATSYAATFGTSADYAIEVEDLMTSFVNSSTYGKRIGVGMVYNYTQGTNQGSALVNLNAKAGTYYEYPFSIGKSIYDTIQGITELNYNNGAINTTSPALGTFEASVDGEGKLILLSGIEYDNVVRYKLVDTVGFLLGNTPYVSRHKQYEYYDFTVSNLPIFSYSTLWVGPIGGTPKVNYTLVLSRDNETASVNSENPLEAANVYPNPANNQVNIDLPEGVQNGMVQIIDATGRIVVTKATNNGVVNMNVTNLNQGAYFVKIFSTNASITKSLIIK